MAGGRGAGAAATLFCGEGAAGQAAEELERGGAVKWEGKCWDGLG